MSPYRDFLPALRLQDTLALSPDGSLVAYADDALGQFNVVVQPIAGGEPKRLTSYLDSSVSQVFWHPDGRSVLFLADANGDENSQLYQVAIDDGKVQALTASPEAEFLAARGEPFSSDGRWLAFAGNDLVPDRQDVLLRDMVTGQTRRVYDAGGRVFAGNWSPDGAWLTVVEWREGNSDHIVYLVPAGGGPARRVTHPDVTATYWLGPWLPDGTGVLVTSDAGRDFTELAVLDVETGELKWLDSPGWDVEEMALSADGRVLLWTVNIEGASQLRARDLRTGLDLTVPEIPMGVVSRLGISPDGRTASMLLSTATEPTNVAVLDLATGDLRMLADTTARRPSSATRVIPSLVRYPARDGKQIPGYLYRPSSSAEQVGVVLAIHGGPPAQERPAYTHDGFFQYLVSQGIAVFAPNVRGSTGYGMAYQKLSYRDWGGGDLGDIADAVAYLRSQSWVDSQRIGLVGRSYGGFLVLSCVSRLSDLDWAAAVDWCGPSNLVSFTRSQPPVWRSKVAAMIGDPETDEDFLKARSPVTYVDDIRAPLFIIQGANDPRVPKWESDQIVDHLRARGTEVRYDVYGDEGHVFGKRENQIRAWSSIGEFLLSHLGRRNRAGSGGPTAVNTRDVVRRGG